MGGPTINLVSKRRIVKISVTCGDANLDVLFSAADLTALADSDVVDLFQTKMDSTRDLGITTSLLKMKKDQVLPKRVAIKIAVSCLDADLDVSLESAELVGAVDKTSFDEAFYWAMDQVRDITVSLVYLKGASYPVQTPN